MGIITLALVTGGALAPDSDPPMWVIVSAGLAIALGTYLGGWRIIRTMGKGLTDLQPQQGFAAQTSAATVILASSHLGFSLSTTHSCLRRGDGRGPRPQGRRGPLVHRHPDVRRLGPDAAGRGSGRRGRGVLTCRAPGAPRSSPSSWSRSSAAIWVVSRRQVVDHTNVNDADDEPAGVVTTAIAAVTPPPCWARPSPAVTPPPTGHVARAGRRARRPHRHGLRNPPA